MSNECQACGACCIPPEDVPYYVDMDKSDVDRIPKRLRLKVFHVGKVFGEDHYRMRTKYDRQRNCVCSALVGTVGKKVHCQIYQYRPRLCQLFEPGSPGCRSSRAEIGLPPLRKSA